MAEVISAALDASPDIPVICLSYYTQGSVAREVESIRILFFLAKPFSMRQLAGTLKNMFSVSCRIDVECILVIDINEIIIENKKELVFWNKTGTLNSN